MATELELRNLKGPAQGHSTSPETQSRQAAAASPSGGVSSVVFLLKLMCPSKIIGTSQTGHTNLGKTSALSSCSCGCRSLRKPRDGGCWDHYISPPASQSQCPCSQLGAPHGDIRQGRREPGGGLHSRWGWGQQQEGARGEQALSGLALPRWSVLL